MPDEGKAKRKVKRQRRERGKLHLYREPSGIWYMRGTVGDTYVHKSTKVHSEDHAKRIRDDRERAILDEKVYGKQVVATFADAVAGYRAAKGAATENSMTKYIDRLLEKFGPMKLRDIDGPLVRKYALDEYPNNKNSSRNTVVITPMACIMKYAFDEKLCPFVRIKRFPDDGSTVHGHDDQYIQTFLERCYDPELRAIVALMTTTGVRCIEALRIEKSQINRSTMTIALRPDQTKNGKGWELALTGQVLNYIDAIPESTRSRVFHWPGTNNVDAAIDRACDKAGLERTSAHRIGRHSFAERMLRLGYDAHTVMRMGNWMSFQVFSKRYGHLVKSKVDSDVRTAAADLLKPKLKVVGGN